MSVVKGSRGKRSCLPVRSSFLALSSARFSDEPSPHLTIDFLSTHLQTGVLLVRLTSTRAGSTSLTSLTKLRVAL